MKSRISQEAFFANSRETSSSNIDVLSLHDTAAHVQVATCSKLEVRVAGRRMRFVVFESVKVLVALAAYFAAVWFLLLHAQSAGVRR